MGKIQIFREILTGLRREKLTRKYCPRCRNPYISLSSKFDVWLLPEQYICEECGYHGPIVLEIEEGKPVETRDSIVEPSIR
ncbi:MAG: hypothetical protein NWF11_07995 [Candidatus Bathyarchaeota archaeon]|nr:hypothetical protein [Candidatus Bathyarchaeota archaeon]